MNRYNVRQDHADYYNDCKVVDIHAKGIFIRYEDVEPIFQLLHEIKERVDIEGGFDRNDTSTYEKLSEICEKYQV
jgi:hypothetical protein